MVNDSTSNGNNDSLNIADAIGQFSLSGPAIAILSSASTILTLSIGIGSIEFMYLCIMYPAKVYTAITVLIIPLIALLLNHKATIEKALRNYKKPATDTTTVTTITSTTAPSVSPPLP